MLKNIPEVQKEGNKYCLEERTLPAAAGKNGSFCRDFAKVECGRKI
jgi:hypothetical protein